MATSTANDINLLLCDSQWSCARHLTLRAPGKTADESGADGSCAHKRFLHSRDDTLVTSCTLRCVRSIVRPSSRLITKQIADIE